MANEIAINFTVQDMAQMAQAIAKSGFCGVTSVDQAMTLMMIAQAEGRHPGIISRDYHIINGKPTLKADTMLARFQDAGGCVRWIVMTDEKCAAEFSHPKGGALVVDWDMARAKRAGITGNPTWTKYPRAMLKSRVISEGIRAVYPAVICGSYTPEEIEDLRPREIPHEVVYDNQPPADATAQQATQAMQNARTRTEEEEKQAFVNAIKELANDLDSDGAIVTGLLDALNFTSTADVPSHLRKDFYNSYKAKLIS